MDFLKPYFKHEDKRGVIIGIVRGLVWKEINFVVSKKGSIRGGHYHKRTIEGFFTISGKIRIYIKNLINNEENIFLVKKNNIFIIKPYEYHRFEILEDAKWINMLTESIEINKDILKIT